MTMVTVPTLLIHCHNGYGVAGIAYLASLMPLKVLSNYGGGTVADIAEAIKFAADNDADVLNMSLGGGGESHLIKDAINYAHQRRGDNCSSWEKNRMRLPTQHAIPTLWAWLRSMLLEKKPLF